MCPQEVAAVDGLYRIRVPRVFLQADRQPERQVEGYLTAFVRAVCISNSGTYSSYCLIKPYEVVRVSLLLQSGD